MKVGLIDIDSKIPNLALMKLSQHHKQLGHEVELASSLWANQYDLVFASKIFTYTMMPILPPNAKVGGSGCNLKSKLIDPIEHIMPDYSLYNCDFAIGYTSRGCNRKCPFCIVPKKEGKWEPVADIYEFWNGQDKIMLLDNSLNTEDWWFDKILNQLIKEKIKVDFSQGLDIRLLGSPAASLLSRCRLWKRIHFAWDNIHDESEIKVGIKILKKYKLNYVSLYVLIGFNSTPEEDLYRVETLRGLGVDSFVMPYDKFNDYQRRFARWVNHKAIFKSVKWEDYRGNV